MFLLALIALSVLALLSLVAGGLAVVRRACATGSQAAVRAAAQVLRPDTGMPEHAQTNHPVSLREARLANDASSPSATAGVCPASESDDLDHTTTPADASAGGTTGFTPTVAPSHCLPPSASPASSRGLAPGVSHDWASQPLPPCESGAHGLDLSSCTASPRPRIKCGDAGRRRAISTTTPALHC